MSVMHLVVFSVSEGGDPRKGGGGGLLLTQKPYPPTHTSWAASAAMDSEEKDGGQTSGPHRPDGVESAVGVAGSQAWSQPGRRGWHGLRHQKRTE